MENDNRNKQIIKTIKNVLDAAHKTYKATMAANLAITALKKNDKEEMIGVISKYANKYERFVNATTFITGKWVQRVPDFYSDKSIEYIRNDVEFCIFIVYLKTAFDNGLELAIKKVIKKQFGVDELLLEGFSWIS